MTEDVELLRRYVEERSDQAFAELVQRYLGLVYAAALRQLGGATHRAEEATQLVFIALARKARTLTGRRELAGWLYTSTHHACAKIKRTEQRRQQREQEVFIMNETTCESGIQADWERLRPVLDEALHELKAADREAILLRFFHNRRLAEVGEAFDVSEDAARMRIERALDRLREALARRQITSTSAALGLLLANQPVVAIPAALGATVTGAALTTGTAATVGVFTFLVMNTKTTMVVVGAVAALGYAIYAVQTTKRVLADERESFSRERDALQEQLRSQQQRVDAAARRVAELEAAPAARAQPASNGLLALANAPVASPPAGPTLSFRAVGPDEVRAQRGRNIDTTYSALYRQLGWTPAQREHFRATMVAQVESAERLFKLASTEARAKNPSIDRAGLFEILEAIQAQMHEEQQAEIRRTMGVAAEEALAAFQEQLPVRAIANQLATAFFNSETPITPTQADELTTILARHAVGPIGRVEAASLKTEAAIKQAVATGLLNPEQAAQLRVLAELVQTSAQAERDQNTLSATAAQAANGAVEK